MDLHKRAVDSQAHRGVNSLTHILRRASGLRVVVGHSRKLKLSLLPILPYCGRSKGDERTQSPGRICKSSAGDSAGVAGFRVPGGSGQVMSPEGEGEGGSEYSESLRGMEEERKEKGDTQRRGLALNLLLTPSCKLLSIGPRQNSQN